MKNILYIFALTLIFGSCEDFLDREPVEQVSINQQFSSVSGLMQALNGTYAEYESIYSNIYFLYADVVAGNVKFAPNPQGIATVPELLQTVYSFEEQANQGSFSSYYQNAYGLVNALNLILENIDDVPNLNESKKQQVIAEVLAMRGSIHFDLSKLFAQTYSFSANAQHLGIVYNTETIVAGEDFPSRKSLENTYDLIESDFLEALELFTNSPALDFGPETSYFNTLNTRALLSRLYLYQEEWQKVIEQASVVINSNIALTPRAQLVEEWAEFEPLSEALLEFTPPLTSEEGLVSSSVSTFFELVINEDGEVIKNGRYATSQDLISLYDDEDIRGEIGLLKTKNISTQTDSGSEDLPYTFTQKFPANDGSIMIRLSEVYLNRSEAYAQIGEDASARQDLQSIRLRANPNAQPVNLSGDDLIEEILVERRRELAFESHLLFDLARNGKSIIRNDGCDINICQLDFPNDRFILPIPENSILINENMVQNEGY